MTEFKQLSEFFSPEHYELIVDIDRSDRVFSGTTKITGKLISGSVIKLHAKDLNIKSATVNGKEADFSFADNDELHLETEDRLNPGEYTLVLTYDADLTDSMHGLYPCYFKVDDQKAELVATQFESHHAREVFPCIDEPAAKATFDVTLKTETNVTVLGNMPIKHQTEENQQLITAFDTTPKMSSYLLAWVVGDLQHVAAKTKSGIDVAVWSTKAHDKKSLEFALDIGLRAVEFYEDFFETPYPLPKIDHVALPDFSSGAMENWGLITYRESALIASDQATFIEKKYIATVIAHELAHQWFGNLVTMKWWDDLWLNESFANMMEYLAVDKLEPDWKMWKMFNSQEGLLAFDRDSLRGVQPVYLKVNHPDEINTIFDGAIVYAKGGRLLRMVQNMVGEDAFRTGLKAYFKKYAYQNTEGKDLWQELSIASGLDINSIMNNWLKKPGYPIIDIKDQAETFELTQSRFFTTEPESDDTIWQIPLNSTDKTHPTLMTEQTLTIPNNGPFRLNDQNTAHFITNYPESLKQEILDDISSDKTDVITDLQFISEQLIIAQSGRISLAEMIDVIEKYQNKDDADIWSVIGQAISRMRSTIDSDPEALNNLRQFAKKIATPLYQKLGWQKQPGEFKETADLRSEILGLMTFSQDKDTLNTAREIFDQTDFEEIDSDIRSIVLVATVKNFDEDNKIAEDLLKKYPSTTDASIKSDIETGLTSVKNPDMIDQILQAMMDSNQIRPQDIYLFFAHLMASKYSRQQTWNWMKNNWDWIQDTFGSDKSFDYFPRYSARAIKTEAGLAEFNEFFTPLEKEPSLKRLIIIGRGQIQSKIAQIDRDFEPLKKRLEQEETN